MSRNLKTSNSMETIIGLLFILLPVIFKLIGKKLEQSGKTDVSERMREIVEAMGEEFDDAPEQSFEPAEPVQMKPVEEMKPVEMKPVFETKPRVEGKPVAKKPKVKKPILVEEEKKKGEKIDPKKLVIYSEIMKPKFTE